MFPRLAKVRRDKGGISESLLRSDLQLLRQDCARFGARYSSREQSKNQGVETRNLETLCSAVLREGRRLDWD